MISLSDLFSVAPGEVIRIGNICDQLGEHGLLNWRPVKAHGGTVGGFGKITAKGIGVIEETVARPVAVAIHHHNVTVSGSSNVQIGNTNSIQANVNIARVSQAIDESQASPTEKVEAKSLWSKLTNNAAFAAIVGAVVTMASSAH